MLRLPLPQTTTEQNLAPSTSFTSNCGQYIKGYPYEQCQVMYRLKAKYSQKQRDRAQL